MEQPTNGDIMGALHQHDLRLVRLEGKVDGLDRDVTRNGTRTDLAFQKLEDLAEAVAKLSGGQRLILLIVGVGIPLIAGLELWDRIGL
jgi:hypothetical protein